MFIDRRKIVIITVAIVLIPILLAMTPIGLINKCGSSTSKDHQVQRGAYFPFHSITVCQDDTSNVSLISVSRMIATEVPLHFQALNSILIVPNFFSKSLPLRC